MSSVDLSLQGILFLPFIAMIVLFIHLRDKSYWIDEGLVKLDMKLDSRNKKIFLFLSIFILALIWGLIISSIVFPSSDVDEAMTGAIRAFFINGQNPYHDNVVPHILYTNSGHELILGKYNYGPVDLVVYGLFYFIFSPFVGNTWWIYCTNVIFMILTYAIMRLSLINKIPHTITLISFLFLFSWFFQDNAVLMCLLLSLAWLVYNKFDSTYKHPLITIILTLAVLTKLYVAFVLLGYFVYVLKKDIYPWIINGIIGLITTLIVIFPFGIVNVLSSIFLFHVDLNIREGYATIQGGIPTYLELLNLKILFIPLAIILVLLFLYLCEIYAQDQLNLKLAVFTTLNLVLLPSSGYAFFIIPSFFLLSQYYLNHYGWHSNENALI